MIEPIHSGPLMVVWILVLSASLGCHFNNAGVPQQSPDIHYPVDASSLDMSSDDGRDGAVAVHPGTGDMQAQDSFVMPNGQLLQDIWRSNQA